MFPSNAAATQAMEDGGMFVMLGILKSLKHQIEVSTLDAMFNMISIDPRTWDLLTVSQIPQNEISVGMNRLQRTVLELAKRINKKLELGVNGKPLKLDSIVDQPLFTEETNFAYRIYSWSNHLQQQILRFLKPQFAEMETYMEERGALKPCNLKSFYKQVKYSLDVILQEKMSYSSRLQQERERKNQEEQQNEEEKESKRPNDNSDFSKHSHRRESSSKVSTNPSEYPSQCVDDSTNQDAMTNVDTTVEDIWTAKELGIKKGDSFQLPNLSTDVVPQLKADGDDQLDSIDPTLSEEEENVSSYGSHIDDSKSNKAPQGSKLLDILTNSSAVVECYPLPEPIDKDIPSMEYLSTYIGHHTKSFSIVESLLDVYLLNLMCKMVALSMLEILNRVELYAEQLRAVNDLAGHFIRLGLPLIERLLRIEPTFVRDNLFHLSFNGIEKGVHYSDARHIIRKAKLFNAIFASLDIFIFPTTLPAHAIGAKALSVSSLDPEFILSGGYDNAVRIWDCKGRKCLAQFIGHQSVITWVSFARLDSLVISASFDGTIKVWNARTAEILTNLIGHEDAVLSCDLSSKDKHLVSGSMDCTLRLWALSTGKCLRIFRGHRHWVKTVKFIENDQAIISTGLDHKIFVWMLRTTSSNSAPRQIIQHADYVLDFIVLPMNKVISTSMDHTIKVWDWKKGTSSVEIKAPPDITCLALAKSKDSKLFAAAFFDNTVLVYDASTYKVIRTLRCHNDGILSVTFVGNRSLLIGTSDGNVQVLPL